MPDFPRGTVTFLFTDIEGSTRLLQHLGDRYAQVLSDQRQLLRAAFQEWGGHELGTEGDSFFVAFSGPTAALAAVVTSQRALAAYSWPEGAPVRVRMGLHTGEPTLTPEGYVGLDVHRAARINAAGHGGQILLSQRTHDLVAPLLPVGVSLRDMGAHRLKDLLHPEHLFQVVIEDLPAEFPPLKSLSAHPNNLPLQLTSFIGREREMDEVKQRLTTTRLLTLTGTGGTGKTRLALQVAADLVEVYADGVWLVELAALTEPSLVPQAVVGALHLREEPGRTLTETLLDYLHRKQLLLVLDNCEHLIHPCACLAETLLRGCPQVQVLATSREALGILGEVAWRVSSLPVPDPEQLRAGSAEGPSMVTQYEGVRLFVERGLAVQSSFTVTRHNAPALAEVCHRLDGIPLAIELAAARVRALPVEQIAQRLDDRFRLLTGGSRTALPRQQTLRALIDWSYDLLTEPERVLLRRLSVFAGGWTLEAAEAVCTDEGLEGWEVIDRLTTLVEKSLVQYEEQEGEGRYRLLETIRQYGAEQLQRSGEEALWHERHRDWYLALAERARPALIGPEAATWHRRLEQERDNLRAALISTLARGEADPGLRFVASLWRFWEVRGYWTEGRERLTEALALSEDVRTKRRAYALLAAATLADQQGDYAAAWPLYEACLALYRELNDLGGAAAALMHMGGMLWYQGELPRARSLLEEAVEIQRASGDSLELAGALNNLAGVLVEQGEVERARAMYEQTLEIRRPLGNQRETASSLANLGVVAHMQEDLEGAWRYNQEALALFRELGDRQHTATVVQNQGMVRYAQGNLEGAHAYLEESRVIRQELGDKRGVALSLARLGLMARDRGEYKTAHRFHAECFALNQEIGNRLGLAEGLTDVGLLAVAANQPARAARLLGAAEAQLEAFGAALTPVDRADKDRAIQKVQAALDEKVFAAAWAEGRAMSLEQAVRVALETNATSCHEAGVIEESNHV
jgi:predicted ATPase/class 3 adenylate cyclase